jgi:hypothetical protein
MSLSAAVLDALIASGATREQIVAVIKADMAEEAAREERQIPWERLRRLAFERDGEKCGWCGCLDGPFEVDHIIARANGGENILENVVVSCRSCNRAKKDREEAEWSSLHARRVHDRERKRRQRIRDKSRDACDIPDKSTVTRDPPDGSPNDIYLTPSLAPHEKPKPKGLVKKIERGTRLSADWEPRPLSGKALAMVDAWQPGAIERELAKFKNYWLAKGANAARTDWQRTWVNWLISADERQPRQSYERASNPTGDALARVQAAIRGGSAFR